MAKYNCHICSKPCDSSEGCWRHKKKKGLNKSIKKRGEKQELLDKQKELFLDIWNKRKHVSEVSGEYLGEEPLSIFFHHILEKRNYPELILVPENIILLTFAEHQKVESDKNFYEEINKRREKLKEKFLD